jgi:hypothetical protein
MLQEVTEHPDFFIKIKETFTESESVNFIFEFMPGQDLFHVI